MGRMIKKCGSYWWVLLIVVGLALSVADAQMPEKGYYDYQGTINHQLKIRMSLYLTGREIAGSYFYEKHRQEITVKGSIAANKVVLYEYDKGGRNTGVFEGYMQTVDSIEGFWSTPGGRHNYPFHLGLVGSAVGAEYGKRYQDAGAENDAIVETFAARIQKYLIHNEKRKLAALVRYPTVVKAGGKTIRVQSAEEFHKNYQEIFYPEFKMMLINAVPRCLFSNYQGIMFGGDAKNIWIGCSPEGCYILKINN